VETAAASVNVPPVSIPISTMPEVDFRRSSSGTKKCCWES
jgi:hypothetical protein